jgi:hypothetical protein
VFYLSVPSSYFCGCLQYFEIIVPLRQTLFLKITGSRLELNQGNGVGVPFQYSILVPQTV